jgi:hypothetical protein
MPEPEAWSDAYEAARGFLIWLEPWFGKGMSAQGTDKHNAGRLWNGT